MGEDRTAPTADGEVRKGIVVTTPIPPTNTDREYGAAVKTVGTEVGRRKNNGLNCGMGERNVSQQQHS